MPTPQCFDRYHGETVGALLGCRFSGGRLLLFSQSVYVLHKNEYSKGDYEKTDDSIKKYSVVECHSAAGLGGGK